MQSTPVEVLPELTFAEQWERTSTETVGIHVKKNKLYTQEKIDKAVQELLTAATPTELIDKKDWIIDELRMADELSKSMTSFANQLGKHRTKMVKDKESKQLQDGKDKATKEQKASLETARKTAANVREVRAKLSLQIYGIDDSKFQAMATHAAATAVRKLDPMFPHLVKGFGAVAQWSSDPGINDMLLQYGTRHKKVKEFVETGETQEQLEDGPNLEETSQLFNLLRPQVALDVSSISGRFTKCSFFFGFKNGTRGRSGLEQWRALDACSLHWPVGHHRVPPETDRRPA